MNRTKIIILLVISLFLLLSSGLIYLEIVQFQKYRDLSNNNRIRLLPQMGARGKILDRDGNIIVDNKLAYDVLILPQELIQRDRALLAVSKILGASFKDLKDTFNRSYVAPSIPILIARNIDIKKAIALEEAKNDIPGIIVQPHPQRAYPYGELACHVIGYVSEIDHWRLTKLADYGYKTKDLVGFGGVEEKYDYYLRQEEGGLSVEVDHQARFMRVLGFKPPRNGQDVQLTLNLAVQKIAEDKLKSTKGCVILMDPYSGEVIAMASSPNFNPGVFVDKINTSLSGIFNSPDAPLINRAISGLYPAGSVFKVIVAAAALENKKIDSSTTFSCKGSTFIGKQEFNCWNTHNAQNLIAAIAHSCNVFFYHTGLLTGAQAIHDYALKFGLSNPTYFELPYEEGGFVPSPLQRKINKFSRYSGIPFFAGKNWFDGDTANLSIGQGDLLVTPLQMTRMMAVFANKGQLVTPYIVKSVDGKDISIYQRKAVHVPLKVSTIDYIRYGLRSVVTDPGGTGSILSDLPITIAGKTGTAQTPRGQPHAWFVGFFPFKSPKFVICVFLEHGGPGYLSCVLAKQIIGEMIKEGLI